MGGMNSKRPTAIKGTMNHAKTSASREIFAGTIISMVQYLAPLRYVFLSFPRHIYWHDNPVGCSKIIKILTSTISAGTWCLCSA
jgi:hypothetical protein